MLTFNQYQQLARETKQFPDIYVGDLFGSQNVARYIYPAMGMAEETGEVLSVLNKCVRNDNGIVDEEDINRITKEIGDLLWFMTTLADELGISMNDVAESNIAKLKDRMKRDVIKSSGDNR